jgi:Pvc16 N-terminal domain/IPT/TIG domain
MSTYKAIRAVSSTLHDLLANEMQDGPISVTLLPPDIAPTTATGKRINLYLYLISENQYLKNQEILGEGYPGAYGNPPLSLNLHYLMTGFSDTEAGDDRDLFAQETLGDAMRVMHDFAIITHDSPYLDPVLQHDFERVKISLQPASLEEFAKIWTALPQANFRCSVAYNVTVVQIESQRLRQLAAPVLTRRLHMTLMSRPEIESVYRTPTLPGDPIGDARAAVGQSLTIIGRGFKATKTWVKLGSLDPIGVLPISDESIQLTVPDAQYPPDFDNPLPRAIAPEDQLQPGAQLVQVIVQRPGEGVQGGLDRGATFTEAVTQSSSLSVFMLVPSITGIAPNIGNSGTTLTVNGTRLFDPDLKSYVYVSDISIEVPLTGAQTATQIQVSLAGLATAQPPLHAPGQYPVRVQVNGALTIDSVDFTYT